MSDEINELIYEWETEKADRKKELETTPVLSVAHEKAFVSWKLIDKFIGQLRYLRDEV